MPQVVKKAPGLYHASRDCFAFVNVAMKGFLKIIKTSSDGKKEGFTIRKWAAPVLCGLFLFLCMKFVLMIGYVPTASMEPAIAAGSLSLPGTILSTGPLCTLPLGNRGKMKRLKICKSLTNTSILKLEGIGNIQCP